MNMYKKLATLAICTLCSPIVANTTNLDASQDVAAAFHLASELPLAVGSESITYSTDSFSRPSPLLKKLTLNQNQTREITSLHFQLGAVDPNNTLSRNVEVRSLLQLKLQPLASEKFLEIVPRFRS